MELVQASDLSSSIDKLVKILDDDGVICFPAESNYRLGASALSHKAVSSLMAAKRRAKHAPALVFISNPAMLSQVADPIPALATRLAEEFWPGPLTLLLQPGEVFPSKVRRSLTKATGWLGVRVPGHEVAQGIVKSFGRPMLVSSANISKKGGATSPAQVRKNFGRQVEAMVDSGDLPHLPPSTLVEVDLDGNYSIKREGAVTADAIREVAEKG